MTKETAVVQDGPVPDNVPAIKAFVAAQAAMTTAAKGAKNPHFGKTYATLQSVQEACLPALHANGFCVMQPVIHDGEQDFVETRILHESGEIFSTRVPLIVDKNNMQGYGSAVTYARRYGLMALSGIAPEDDDGNAAASSPPQSRSKETRPANQPPPPTNQPANGLGEAALKAKFQEFCTRLGKIVEPDHIDALLAEYKAVLNQIKRDKPQVWNGTQDYPSVEQRVKSAREAAAFVATCKSLFLEAESRDDLHARFSDNKAEIDKLPQVHKTAVETALTLRDQELSGAETPFDEGFAA